ncbi:MAG: autotransporter domain-containing protein [Methyloceanibacter sp.]|nr:autotransporter domain-containing protein [Methyloceanibacter sp.]
MLSVAPRRQPAQPHVPLRHNALRHGLLVSCCALALGLAVSPEASAQATFTWTGSVSTNWLRGFNWNSGFVPGRGPIRNVDVDIVNVVPNQPIIDGSDPVYLPVDLGTGDIQVDIGLLTIRNAGELRNQYGRIGQELGSNGAVTVTGDGSVWENTGNLYVGYYGTGTLNIENGGRVSTEQEAYIGLMNGGNGEVTVTGEDPITGVKSTLETRDNLVVGDNGTGTLVVSYGGMVSSGNGYIGDYVRGNGEVTVTGDGSTWNVGGELVVGRQGTATLTIANGGTVTVAGGTGVVTVGRNLGATGTVSIGAGVGETPAAPGRLNAAELRFGDGRGALNFNHTDESGGFEFAPGMSGIGTINHASGFTNLTGDSTNFQGTANVTGGTLSVNNVLGGTVIVDGGRLEGIGQIGSLNVNRGTFAPGNSIGTMTVNGPFVLGGGGTFEVEVDAAGNSDQVIVNGTVNLTGATLTVLAESGTYATRTDYTIVENDGTDAVSGTFGQVSVNSAFLTPSVDYAAGDGNDVVLTLEAVPFTVAVLAAGAGGSGNQFAVARALGQFPTDNALFGAIFSLTSFAEARAAFDALSGEVHASVAGTLVDDSRYAREAVMGRMMQAGHKGGALGEDGPQVAHQYDDQAMRLANAYDGKSLVEVPQVSPLAFWTQAYGAWGTFDGDGNAATADRDLGGFISGMDADVGGGWRVGLATGASFSDVSVDARYSGANTSTYHLGGYGSGEVSGLALRAGGLWAWSEIETSRAVTFTGFFERQNADYDADTGQLFGEIAYPTQMGGVELEPFAGLAYVSVETGGFREKGGPDASLRSSGFDQDVGYTTLGLRAAKTIMWGGMAVTPRIEAAWVHAFDDVTPDASLAFASTGIGFDVAGVPLAEDSALLDAGLDLAVSDRLSAGVSYQGQYADNLSDNAVKGRLTWLFN